MAYFKIRYLPVSIEHKKWQVPVSFCFSRKLSKNITRIYQSENSHNRKFSCFLFMICLVLSLTKSRHPDHSRRSKGLWRQKTRLVNTSARGIRKIKERVSIWDDGFLLQTKARSPVTNLRSFNNFRRHWSVNGWRQLWMRSRNRVANFEKNSWAELSWAVQDFSLSWASWAGKKFCWAELGALPKTLSWAAELRSLETIFFEA